MIEFRSFETPSPSRRGRTTATLLITAALLLGASHLRAQCSGGINKPTIWANPTLVEQGRTTTVSWSFSGAGGQCNLTANPFNPQWSGSAGTSGSRTVTVNATTYFTASCGGPGVGGGCESVLVTVRPPNIPPTPTPTRTPAPPRNVATPIGSHDTLTCGTAAGWTCDADAFNQPLQVHFYKDGPAGTGQFVGATTANLVREPAVGALCGGNAAHGYSFAVPASFRDGGSHTLHAYAINVNSNGAISGSNPLLNGSPKSTVCPLTELIAKPGPVMCGALSRPVTFDGSGSLSTAEPPRPLTRYTWDFGDSFFGSGVRPSHAYARTGVFNVGLKVGDATGQESAQAFTTARIYPTVGSALSTRAPSLTYSDFDGRIYADALASGPSCSNWAAAMQVQVREFVYPFWQVLDNTPLIPAQYSWSFRPSFNATEWRMTVSYYIVNDGVITGVGVQEVVLP